MLMRPPSVAPTPRPVRVARTAMWLGLSAVAVAAAVISFTALRDLGRLSAFGAGDWLLPVVIDAGAAVGSLVWLGRWAPPPARRFARFLAITLLSASVAGNAGSHGMAAEHITPHWVVVVAVSALAPAVLGAVVHLVVLVTDRDGPPVAPAILGGVSHDLLLGRADLPPAPAGPATEAVAALPPVRLVAELAASRETMEIAREAREASPEPPATLPAGDLPGGDGDAGGGDLERRAREMVLGGAGRLRLVEELGVSEHQARQWAARHRPPAGSPRSSHETRRETSQ